MHGMQKLRNAVLNEEFESELNRKLLKNKHGRWQFRVDKTNFCEHYESQLLQQSKLTKHQTEKFEELKEANSSRMHVKANAGSGKTFLAVKLVIETLQETNGQILFVAPALQLCFYFVRWLARRGKHENLRLTDLLERLVFLTPEDHFVKLAVDKRVLVCTKYGTLCNTEFDLMVVDEAHDIYRDDVFESGFLDKLNAKRQLLLSNLSQSSVLTPQFPQDMAEVRLTEVVRCTKRIVAGAAAFHGTPDDKEELSSLCPDGPPLKSFLFAAPDVTTYVEQSVAAIRYIVQTYPGISLHQRLALLVSDDLYSNQTFKESLQKALNIGERQFGFTTLEKSMRALPLDLLEDVEAQGSEDTDDQEMIVLDTVDHAKGLEQLFVICIDLDSEIKGNGSKTDAKTRARLYQGLTRAQLHAVVVNKLVKGGWLEFLGLIKPEVQKFEEAAGMEETTAKKASQIIEGKPPEMPKGEPEEEQWQGEVQGEVQGEEQQQKHQENQREEHQDQQLKEQGPAKVAPVVSIDSMVWDTSDIEEVARENPPTNFNPCVKDGWKHDAGMSNFNVVMACRVTGCK